MVNNHHSTAPPRHQHRNNDAILLPHNIATTTPSYPLASIIPPPSSSTRRTSPHSSSSSSSFLALAYGWTSSSSSSLRSRVDRKALFLIPVPFFFFLSLWLGVWRARVDFFPLSIGGLLDLLPFGRALVFGSRVGESFPAVVDDEEGRAGAKAISPWSRY